jgi:hypothetical protein
MRWIFKKPSVTRKYTFLVLLATPAIFLGVTGVIDPYHDGAIFPASIGVSDGLAIYSEVNHQYGFLPVYINAILPFLFGNYFIFYRIVGLLVILGNAFLVYKILRGPLQSQIPIVFSLASLLITPAWSFFFDNEINGMGSWPNMFGIFFTLLSISIIQISNVSNYNTRLVFLSGFFSSLAVGARPTFFAVCFLQFFGLLLMAQKKHLDRTFVKIWFFGAFSGILLMLTILTSTGSLVDAYKQLFGVWFSEAPNSPSLGLWHIMQFLISILFFLVLGIITLLAKRFGVEGIFQEGIIFLVLVGFFFFSLQFSAASFLPSNVNALIDDALARPLFSVAPFLVSLYIYLSFRFVLIRSSRFHYFSTENAPVNLYVWFTCAGMLVQFHNLHPDYIFLSIQPFFIWFGLFLKETNFENYLNHTKYFIPIVLKVTIVFSVLISIPKLDFNRHYYAVSFMKGMQEFDYAKLSHIQNGFIAIDKFSKDEKFRFDCSSGIYSVNHSGYLLNSKWTWNEIPKTWRLENIATSPVDSLIVVCLPSPEWNLIYLGLENSKAIERVYEQGDFLFFRVKKSLEFLKS